jgi:toxin ParE1/3/4
MRYTLRLFPAADQDIDEAAAYIARSNMDAAMRFLGSVDDTLRLIREHPMRQPIYDTAPAVKDVRKRAVIGFSNYLIFYRVNRRAVEVIRLLHGARDIGIRLREKS